MWPWQVVKRKPKGRRAGLIEMLRLKVAWQSGVGHVPDLPAEEMMVAACPLMAAR